jgi:hypothetical protein
VTYDFMTSALRGKPYWGYVHGGKAFHARRSQGDRVAVCGVGPKPSAAWLGTYRWRLSELTAWRWGRLRTECSGCHRLLREARIGWK